MRHISLRALAIFILLLAHMAVAGTPKLLGDNWASQVDFPFLFALRAELEFRAGGNPSWNTGVDYRKQLNGSVDRAEVRALYKQAVLSLDADLDAVNAAARISANPASVQYLEQNIIFNGHIRFPVLTMHTTGDGLVVNQNESAYKDVVDEADNNRYFHGALLQQRRRQSGLRLASSSPPWLVRERNSVLWVG